MKIIVLMGSPNRRGSTWLLTDRFAQGAREAGHQVEIVDVAYADVHPCTGCVACGYEGTCVQKDGMEAIREKLLSADMMVFATPLYYFGLSAQLKTVVDRFCSFSHSLHARHLKSALLAVAWDDYDWTFEALVSHYRTLIRYIDLEDMGMILAGGCGTPPQTEKSEHMRRAYEFGKSLR